MSSAKLDLHRLSVQVYDLAVLSQSNNIERINVDELINVGEHLAEALAHIRSLRNMFSPINQLPPEILAKIISHIQYDLPSHSPIPLPLDLNKWAQVLTVCRHWQRTFTNVPFLWGQIHLHRSDCANSIERSRVWLNRAHGVPLKVYLTGVLPGGLVNEDETTEFPVDIFSHASRIEELHISSYRLRESILWKLVDRPAPNLESFSFMVDQEDSARDCLTSLPRVFQDDMPRLKHLTLGNVSSWPFNRFPNLTRLRLQYQPKHDRPTLSSFLEFLAASPRLEELVLIRAGPSPLENTNADVTLPVVVLPCLQYLEIGYPDQWRSKGHHLQMFLEHLDIPPAAIRCFYEEDPYLPIAYHLMQHGSNLKQIVDITEKIVMTSYRTAVGFESFMGFKGSTLYYNCPETPPNLTPPSTLTLWENVKELTYAPSWSWQPGNLAPLLRQFPLLRKLTISGNMWRSSKLQEAARILQEVDFVRRGFKYAPLLEELYLYSPEDELSEQSEEGSNAVMMICNVRANNGHGLKRVVLDRFPDEGLEMLREYFSEVEPSGERKREFSRDDTLGIYWRSYDRLGASIWRGSDGSLDRYL